MQSPVDDTAGKGHGQGHHDLANVMIKVTMTFSTKTRIIRQSLRLEHELRWGVVLDQ